MQKWSDSVPFGFVAIEGTFLLDLHCAQELVSSIVVSLSPPGKRFKILEHHHVQKTEMIHGITFQLHNDWQGSPMAPAEEKVAWAKMWSWCRHLGIQLEPGGRRGGVHGAPSGLTTNSLMQLKKVHQQAASRSLPSFISAGL